METQELPLWRVKAYPHAAVLLGAPTMDAAVTLWEAVTSKHRFAIDSVTRVDELVYVAVTNPPTPASA